jgi:hypothetical protein
MQSDDIYLWNVLISHYIIHIVELLARHQIINEPPHHHNYENHEALEHLHRFVNWVGGIDETVERYVPYKQNFRPL